MAVQGRIKEGTLCMIDFQYFRWPNMPKRLQQPNFSKDMVFTMEQSGDGIQCWADGYGGHVFGRAGRYGHGAMHLRVPENIVKIKTR